MTKEEMTKKERDKLCEAIDGILADDGDFDAAMIILFRLAKRKIKPLTPGNSMSLLEAVNAGKRKFVI